MNFSRNSVILSSITTMDHCSVVHDYKSLLPIIYIGAGSTTPWGYRLPYFSKNGVLPGAYTFFFIRTFKTELGFMFLTFLCFKA